MTSPYEEWAKKSIEKWEQRAKSFCPHCNTHIGCCKQCGAPEFSITSIGFAELFRRSGYCCIYRWLSSLDWRLAMLVDYDPDGYVAEVSHYTCPFHKKNPGVPYAGCGCTGVYSRRRATPDERIANKYRRLSKEVPVLRAELRNKERELATISYKDHKQMLEMEGIG